MHLNLAKYSKNLVLMCLMGMIAKSPGLARAQEWMTYPSTYTHDSVRGQRVDQYAQRVEPTVAQRADFQRSGYRNYRSTLQAGQSADNIHIVEQWGKAVLPYEQWRFPYRPYGVPYDQWGPQAPYGFLNGLLPNGIGYGAAPWPTNPMQPAYPNTNNGGDPSRAPGYWNRPAYGNYYPGQQPYGFPLSPQYQGQPWFDGTYPTAPPLVPGVDSGYDRRHR
ncbi:MAG: hypothetical protein KDB22_21495 [Planctomycetales bacterium]|nr:hypothetical protein [Planctomycetales bacterium]